MVDMTFVKDEDKARLLAEETGVPIEDAQFIIDLKKMAMDKIGYGPTPLRVRLAVYSLASLVGALIEAITVDGTEGPEMDFMMNSLIGALEECRQVRNRVGSTMQ